MLHLVDIRKVLLELVPRDRWIDLAEIYAIVEANRALDEADHRPVSKRHTEPRWKRNVRAVLQELKSSEIRWRRPAQYLFPGSGQKLGAGGAVSAHTLHTRSSAQLTTNPMQTFLITWNPTRWSWEDLPSALESIDIRGSYRTDWSVGNRTHLPPGSRVFLMKLGTSERGLLASGWTVTAPAPRRHWDPDRAAAGDLVQSVLVDFDVLSPLPLLSHDDLRQPPLADFNWTPQASGVEIPAPIAAAIELRWLRAEADPGVSPAVSPSTHFEGALRRVYANVFERDETARRACIAHFGSSCFVCGFSFPAVYGDEFLEFVHVHHCVPLSTIRKEYAVDPLRDLKPVCPNCHAALHQRTPPYSVDDLKTALERKRDGA